MLSVKIITVGTLKESYLRDAVAEYSKRLSAFCKLNIVELTPEKLSDNPSQKEIDSALETEAKKIMDKIPKGAYICSLCIEGKQISSEELSAEMENIGVSGKSNIVFIIGSSFGLSNTIKQMSNKKLSIATGVAAYPLLCELVDIAKKKWHNLECNVYEIKNEFFGESITVSGLITGRDLISQLKGKNLGDTLLLPANMFRSEGDIMLDDTSVDDIEKALNVKVRITQNDGYDLLSALIDGE